DVTATINIADYVVATLLARATTYEADVPKARAAGTAGSAAVYVAIALSGMTALAAEVIWTRLLSLHFGATVYTFALILAVFLIGLGIGSTIGASMARTIASPRRALGWSQLLLCGAIGTSHSEQVIIIISALSALIMLEPSFSAKAAKSAKDAKGPDTASAPSALSAVGGTALLAVAMVTAGLLARSVHELPGLLVAYGRYSATRIGQATIIYVGEGLNASVAVSELSNGVRNYHNAGKVQASSEPQDMRLQRMLGHLTTLIPANPKKVLVIGCGAGVTAGAVSVDPAVEHET